METLIKEYIAKNKAIVQSQAVSLRNLENQMGQLATAMSSRTQGSLPSNTEDPRRERKEHCKVISLRSGKNVDILIDVTKNGMEFNSAQKPPQNGSMLQQPPIKTLVTWAKLQQLQKKFNQNMLTKKLQHQWSQAAPT